MKVGIAIDSAVERFCHFLGCADKRAGCLKKSAGNEGSVREQVVGRGRAKIQCDVEISLAQIASTAKGCSIDRNLVGRSGRSIEDEAALKEGRVVARHRRECGKAGSGINREARTGKVARR